MSDNFKAYILLKKRELHHSYHNESITSLLALLKANLSNDISVFRPEFVKIINCNTSVDSLDICQEIEKARPAALASEAHCAISIAMFYHHHHKVQSSRQ